MILVYITNPSEKCAVKIANQLLNKRIVACVNMYPIKSMYWWNGEINKDDEYVLLVKTNDNKYDELKTIVKDTHPYDVPCIIKIHAEANEEFDRWIEEETR